MLLRRMAIPILVVFYPAIHIKVINKIITHKKETITDGKYNMQSGRRRKREKSIQ